MANQPKLDDICPLLALAQVTRALPASPVHRLSQTEKLAAVRGGTSVRVPGRALSCCLDPTGARKERPAG
jgi:hypothetical protein